ncbi:MAG TPA: ribose-phosphate diphosphokinase [Chitinophagales bacterium]|nr:ribose-phosphate diphosphokinase [Chitinophagales bacterium]
MKLLFATSSYAYLKNELLKTAANIQTGELEVKTFPDGENYHRFGNDLEGKDIILIGGTVTDTETLELFDLACGAVKQGALSLTLVVPFMGYSTMERAVKKGEIVKAKNRTMLLSAIPKAPMGNRIMLFDIHSEGIPHYFNDDIRPLHIYCKKIVMDAATQMYGRDFVLASTDAGRAKWVESLANELGINAAFVFKRRVSGEETQVTSISANVENKNVVIYDDMIRTGGSLINAAKSYKDAGAKEIAVITTHGLFTNNALDKIKASGIIKKVVCTDSHPNALQIKDSFLEVKTIAGLIAEHI